MSRQSAERFGDNDMLQRIDLARFLSGYTSVSPESAISQPFY